MAQKRGRCCSGETRLKTRSQEAKQAPTRNQSLESTEVVVQIGRDQWPGGDSHVGISSRCRCLGRGTPHAQHHDTPGGTGLGTGTAGASGRAKHLCSSAPHGLPAPLTSEITTPNGYFRHGRATASFLGGKRFPAPRFSSTVDGRTPGRLIAETKTNLN